MSEADDQVKRILDYLEPRVDVSHVAAVASRHRAILDYEEVDRLPLVIYIPYEGQELSLYPYPEAFAEPAKMMVNELLRGNRTSIYHSIDLRDDTPYCLRPNLGCVIIASMFGAEVRVVENTMPWVVPLEDLDHAIQSVLDAPPPDLKSGLLPRVLDQYTYFHEALADYPNCQTALQIVLPDLQGPFNSAELLWGSDIYLSFYDKEAKNKVTALMEMLAGVILIVHDRLKREVRENLGKGYQYQHLFGQKGEVLVREDSVSNISPDHYKELIEPIDVQLAANLGSFGIHSCGRIGRHFEIWRDIPGMSCLDVGQPELNDLDGLYASASPHRIPLTRVIVPEEQLKVKQTSERFPTGVSLLYKAETVAEGHRVWSRYCDHSPIL
jgi:hypothetical protein